MLLFLNFLQFSFFKNHSIFSLLFIVVCLNGCSTPSQKFHNKALTYQFDYQTVKSNLFINVIYANKFTSNDRFKNLHIYLAGDGSPWLKHHLIAKDPTSRNTMILDLMAMDNSPAIFLGRPCYHRLIKSKNCHPKYWTSHRYSQLVIQSMKFSLKHWLKNHPQVQTLTFIGYSGGGTLASLLAPLFQETAQLVTISGNLDTDAWTERHQYSPLLGSLNPSLQNALPARIQQLHLSGSQDTNIPSYLMNSYINKQLSTNIEIFKNQGHCCWNEHWLTILDTIKKN